MTRRRGLAAASRLSISCGVSDRPDLRSDATACQAGGCARAGRKYGGAKGTSPLIAELAARPHLQVQTKVDLLHPELARPEALEKFLRTSAVSGEGMDDLRVAILQAANADGALADSGALNNLRQQEAVTAAIAALDTAATANSNSLPHELILVDLHNALRSLDTLTGNTTTDDILARIFATFCIGK